MTLFYQKGVTRSPMPPPPEQNLSRDLIPSLIGSLLILATAVLQMMGLFWPLERSVIGMIPSSLRPTPPKAILLTMEAGERGFPGMDLAMVLRGLTKLHPRSVLINGEADQTSGSLPLLKSVRSHLVESGVELTEGVIPSPDSTYRPVPLCRYDPPDFLRPALGWPVIAGRASGTGSACYLPDSNQSREALPLLASTSAGDPVGSLWWNCLEPSHVNAPLWLLCGRLMLFPNHTPLLLDSQGGVYRVFLNGITRSDCSIMTLDDFLLKVEEMERGTVSPGFDALWDQSMVIITSPRNEEMAASVISLRERLAFAHLPVTAQALLALIWMIVLICSPRITSLLRLIAGSVLLLGSVMGSSVAMTHGLILPFLPPLITALFLLIPWHAVPRSRS